MTIRLTRRDLLKSASGLLGVAASGRIGQPRIRGCRGASGAWSRVVRNPAHATIDRFLQQAVDNTICG
jgi:hypothetical protein